jgi:hypothetical protein
VLDNGAPNFLGELSVLGVLCVESRSANRTPVTAK